MKGFPDGHYYSPILSEKDMILSKKMKDTEIFKKDIPGIKINDCLINENIKILGEIYKNSVMRFPINKQPQYRYFFENEMFSYMDAIILTLWIQQLKPKYIIEVGSGYTSCVMLDTCEKMNLDTKLIFIEPHAERLKSLITDTSNLIEKCVQDIDISLFENLGENDILFIDSSHVSKAGSDVNHIIHRILPNLKQGVFIHIHDIFWPFEYPEDWLKEGRSWNENYILRAFLQFNDHFQIVYFNDYIYRFCSEYAKTFFPEIEKNSGGSIWLKKIR